MKIHFEIFISVVVEILSVLPWLQSVYCIFIPSMKVLHGCVMDFVLFGIQVIKIPHSAPRGLWIKLKKHSMRPSQDQRAYFRGSECILYEILN